MSDTAISAIIQKGTAAARAAFTPSPAAGSNVLYIWFDTDASPATWVWNGAAWVQINASGGSGINQLTGNVTAGPGTGSQVATIANDAVTFDKLLNATQVCVIGADGAGNFKEITIGSNLTLAAGVLSASGGSSDWTTTVTKAVDDTVTNSSTLTADSELIIPTLAANSVWLFELLLIYSSNDASADFKYDFNVDAGTMLGAMTSSGVGSGDIGYTTNQPVLGAASTSALTGKGDAGGTQFGIYSRGIIQFTNSANFRLRFAQNTITAAKDAKTRIGSILRGKRII